MHYKSDSARLLQGEDYLKVKGRVQKVHSRTREAAKAAGAEVRFVSREATQTWAEAICAQLTEQVAVVSLPQCHWSDGGFVDLIEVSRKARKVGAALVVDATQSLGAMEFSLEEVQPDFVACAGYKWLQGPYGLGFLYASSRWFQARPIEFNWITRKNSHEFSRLVDYQPEFSAGASRFDMGERSNFITLPMGIAALEQILKWGVINISQYLETLTDLIAEKAKQVGLQVADKKFRSPHMLGIGATSHLSLKTPAELSQERIYVSVRGDAMRISPYVFNSPSDIERLFEVLES